MSSYTGGPNDDLLRNSKTQGYDLIAKLIRSNMALAPTERDQLLRHARKLSGQKHIHSVIAEVNSGIHENNETVALKSQDAFRRIIPRYSKTYQILHANTSANGLTIPQENRKFGAGVQYNGGNNVIKLTFPEPIGEAMTLVFWYYSIATQSRSSEGLISYTNRNANASYITTNEANKTISFNAGNNQLTASGLIQGWNHIVITAKNGEQRIYVNNRVRIVRNYNYIDRTIYPIFIFGRYYGVGQHPLNKLAWLSFCKGLADSLWVANDYNGIRDFSDDSPVEEMTTMPFDIDLMPMPNATAGLFQG